MADRNGYEPSIVQHDMDHCFICGTRYGKLDRHEIFGSANREKSKRLGLWVMLCHHQCHLNGVHAHREMADQLKQIGQVAAMNAYGWNTERFIEEIGRNYL